MRTTTDGTVVETTNTIDNYNVHVMGSQNLAGNNDHSPNLINVQTKGIGSEVDLKNGNLSESKNIKEEACQQKAKRCSDGTFCCTTCNKKFASRSATLRHYRNHTGEHPYVCSFCQKNFASKAGVDSHQLRAHNLNTDSALSCSDCGKLFTRRSALEVHLKIHTLDKPYQCEYCGKSFTQKISRDIHLAKHTGKYDFQCSLCEKVFASQAKLNSHNFVHKTPRFTCELCGQSFVRRDTLMVHQHTHTGERPFQCSICSQNFLTHSKLLVHVEVHSQECQYRCTNCSAQFKQKTGLAAHMRRKHNINNTSTKQRKTTLHNTPTLTTASLFTSSVAASQHTNLITSKIDQIPSLGISQKRLFLCPQCGRKFCKKQSLEEHEKVHSGVHSTKTQSHACHLCPKHFAQKSKLSAHLRVHLQEPSYECDICGKRFHRKDVYNHHKFLHTNERPFSCAHCGKAFASKFNLRAHLTIHSPSRSSTLAEFQCDDCGKKFKHKNTFALHRKTHVGDFSHICVTCGKKFMKKSHFEGHLRSHASERPFQCPTCGKRFKERKHCREHVRKAHPSTFSLASLFASITNDDARMDHMADILCPSASSASHEQENSSGLDVSGLPSELQPSLVDVSEAAVASSNLDTSYLLNPEVNLNETSITMSVPMPNLIFTTLEPMLQEMQIPSAAEFLMSTTTQQSMEKNTPCQVDVASGTMSLTIISGEETSSVLSQGIE